ncbi:MAG: hypothetical protein IPJ69_04825 [Deltaproteobacteria bacterium]|nr:MAG: hypothetical protein IPJ69_04825 [Deltaproteobacteria bacterium]
MRNWTPADGVNTTTVFTNDWLLLNRGSSGLQPRNEYGQAQIDHLGEANAEGVVAEQPMTEAEALAFAHHDDELLRVHRGNRPDVFILRQHHISVSCDESRARSSHQRNLSPELARALVYFQSGRGRGPEWCSVYEEGEGNKHLGYVTNWDSNNNPDLNDLLRTLADIEQTAANGRPTSHQNLSLNPEVAVRLARAVPRSQISTLRALVETKMHDNRSTLENLVESPWKTMETAGWFGIGTDLYHLGKHVVRHPVESGLFIAASIKTAVKVARTIIPAIRSTPPIARYFLRAAQFEAGTLLQAAAVRVGVVLATEIGAATFGQVAAVTGAGLAIGIAAGTLINQSVGLVSRAAGGDGRTLSDRIADRIRPRNHDNWLVDNVVSNFLVAHS